MGSGAGVVRDLVDRVKLPEGEPVVFLEGRFPVDYRDRKGFGYLSGLDPAQYRYAAGLVMQKTGVPYVPLSVEQTAGLADKSRDFRLLLGQVPIFNWEVLEQTGGVLGPYIVHDWNWLLPYPIVKVVDGEFRYLGGRVLVEWFDGKDAAQLLAENRAVKTKEELIRGGKVDVEVLDTDRKRYKYWGWAGFSSRRDLDGYAGIEVKAHWPEQPEEVVALMRADLARAGRLTFPAPET